LVHANQAAADGAFTDASAVGNSGQLVLLVKSSTPEYQVTASGKKVEKIDFGALIPIMKGKGF